jgi:hypothetical protein
MKKLNLSKETLILLTDAFDSAQVVGGNPPRRTATQCQSRTACGWNTTFCPLLP